MEIAAMHRSANVFHRIFIFMYVTAHIGSRRSREVPFTLRLKSFIIHPGECTPWLRVRFDDSYRRHPSCVSIFEMILTRLPASPRMARMSLTLSGLRMN